MIRQDEPAPAPAFRSNERGRLRALHRLQALDAAPEEAFEHLVSLVKAVFGVPICAISLVDTDRQFFLAERGLNQRQTCREVSFCAHAIERPEPFVIGDAQLDARFAKNPLVTGAPFIRSYAGIPLITADGYQVGALCVIDHAPREYSNEQLALLGKFADNVMHELELRLTACADHLTQAMSRRAWMNVADTFFAETRRAGASLSVAIMDIDLFKSVNDRHGHAVGDQVLKSFATLCCDHLRGAQKFGRIGGEEFALLLPGVGAADAMLAVERVRAGFAGMRGEFPDDLRCTVSIGVAECETADSNLDMLLSRADHALYRAKAQGRNCCVLASSHDSVTRRAG